MPRQPSPRSRRLVPLVGLLALVLVVPAVLASASSHGAGLGHHHDDGRFTARSQGFPPQPAEMLGARSVRDAVVVAGGGGGGQAEAVRRAVAAAVADPRVAELLQPGWIDHGAVPLPLDGHGGTVDRWEVHLGQPSGATVTVQVSDAAGDDPPVVGVGAEMPATAWQPPLSGDERRRAIDLGRRALVDEGHARARWLDGFAIHGLQQDGSWPDGRWAYATFAVSADHRPELTAWVDLTAGRVMTTSVQAGPQSAGPTARQSSGSPANQLGQPGRPTTADVSWRGWRFRYELTHRLDGLALADGRLDGVQVFKRLSVPAMTVFYSHPPETPGEDRCGPYVDRLGLPELTPVPWFEDQQIVLREFTQRGVDWLELGILDTLGQYVLYHSWYLSEDGQIDGHAFAKGLQCEFFHEHYPFWRLDLDLGGPADDQVVRLVDGQVETMDLEFDEPATSADDHAWSVRDAVTGDRVDVAFDDGTWTVPGEVIPESAYAENMVYGRVATTDGDGQWRGPATLHARWGDGEPLVGEDVALWYRGYLPHTVEEGGELWHSTGVRLQFDLTPRFHTRPGATR